MGGHPKVDKRYETELGAAVEQKPRQLGLAFSSWTCRELVRYLAAKGWESISVETIRRHLHRLGYRVIRPVLTVNSPDSDYQAKLDKLQACQEQAKGGEIILLYEDEVDLNLLPGVIRCWTVKGKQRKIETPGQNVKRYGFGAVNFISGQLTGHISEHKDSAGFISLIEQIVAEYCPAEDYTGPKIGLVVDNYIIHSSKTTKAVLKKYADRLFLVPLPTYSPQLNVIERLWKHLRRRVTHNYLFESIDKLVEAVKQFFKDMDNHRTETLSVIGCPE